MRRVIVIGAPGSGKSTLARRIGARLDLPVFHLDAHYWGPGWKPRSRELFEADVAAIASRDAWVLDGNYTRTWPVTLPRAEAIVWPDLPRRIYLRRAIARLIRHHGHTRPDMATDCPERFDWHFLRHWVWTHPQRRPGTVATIDHFRSQIPVVILRTPRDVRRFTDGLPATLTGSRRDQNARKD